MNPYPCDAEGLLIDFTIWLQGRLRGAFHLMDGLPPQLLVSDFIKSLEEDDAS